VVPAVKEHFCLWIVRLVWPWVDLVMLCMGTIPIVPMNCTLMPVCSRRLPSFGRTVTAPLTDSPSMNRGAFSRRFLSSLTSTMDRSSASSRTMSMSTGVAKKYDILDRDW
jgi:hypothetical protein